MVSESLMVTFNLLTGYVIFLGMECVGVKRFLRFSRRRQHGSAWNFFFKV